MYNSYVKAIGSVSRSLIGAKTHTYESITKYTFVGGTLSVNSQSCCSSSLYSIHSLFKSLVGTVVAFTLGRCARPTGNACSHVSHNVCLSGLRPRHQGGAHGGRAPAKIIRATAKITGLFMLKIEKDQMATLCRVFHGGWSILLSHTHSYPGCHFR